MKERKGERLDGSFGFITGLHFAQDKQLVQDRLQLLRILRNELHPINITVTELAVVMENAELLEDALKDRGSEGRSRLKRLGEEGKWENGMLDDELQCRSRCRKGRVEGKGEKKQEGIDADVAAKDAVNEDIQQIYGSSHPRRHTFLCFHYPCKRREDGNALLVGQ